MWKFEKEYSMVGDVWEVLVEFETGLDKGYLFEVDKYADMEGVYEDIHGKQICNDFIRQDWVRRIK